MVKQCFRKAWTQVRFLQAAQSGSGFDFIFISFILTISVMKKMKKKNASKSVVDDSIQSIINRSPVVATRGSATPFIIAVFVFIMIVGGFSYFAFRDDSSAVENADVGQKNLLVMKNKVGGVMVNNTTSVKADALPGFSGVVLAGTSAPLLDFVRKDYDIALQSGKLVVLYFYADWCPLCKAEFPVMQKVFNEFDTNMIVGFRVNYNDGYTDEEEKNIAREFGVAYQHTKVFLKNGQRILKSPETWDENRYDMEIGAALGQ